MLLITLIALGLLIGLAIIISRPAQDFAVFLDSSKSPSESSVVSPSESSVVLGAELPKAVVILCIRGSDPGLASCIEALLQQDYPQYSIKIVVDSKQDPAWHLVHQALKQERAELVQVDLLRTRFETCSLKCSALIQAIAELDESYEVIAFVDADVVPHATWLRQLVQPLADPEVGVTTANRWYQPTTNQWGSLNRYLWNVAASIIIYCLQIPWAGSMAMKRSVLQRASILSLWQQTLVDDTPLTGELRKLGLKIKFIPMVIVNQENCTVMGCWSFFTRQLLFTKLYHKDWPLIAIYNFVYVIIPGMVLGVLCMALYQGDGLAAIAIGLCLIMLLAIYYIWLVRMELKVLSVVRSPLATPLFRPGAIVKILILIPFLAVFNAAVTVSVMCQRTVRWRGIEYYIGPDKKIYLTQYHLFQSARSFSHRSSSHRTLLDQRSSIL